jgi:hypothetical protein
MRFFGEEALAQLSQPASDKNVFTGLSVKKFCHFKG